MPLNRRKFLGSAIAVSAAASTSIAAPSAPKQSSGAQERAFWVDVLTRVSEPVLLALSEEKLRVRMPVDVPRGSVKERQEFIYLQAMANVLAGIAPWIETGPRDGDEGRKRQQYADWSRRAIQIATDPRSPDYMDFNKGSQPVVDAAFLALAILRAPNELWHKLDKTTQQNLIAALEATRVIKPGFNNWLLFSAMVEAALAFMGRWWDPMRVDYAVRTIVSWYKGDGLYGDGPDFHWDYYNSFVIHPMLLQVLATIGQHSPTWKTFEPDALKRAQRYAAIQERLISPEGTFPAIGRSLCYRFGAFHHLADTALQQRLPEHVSPEQVRCALTAVMRRMIETPRTFDSKGWLRIGFVGSQPSMADSYITSGSSYICTWALLPLGLPATDRFWSGPPLPWTQKRIWQGEAVEADHAL